MSLKKVKVATSLGFCLKNNSSCLVSLCDTTVLPFVIDCRLIENKGSVVQAVVKLLCSSLHATILVYLQIVHHTINHMHG